MPHQPPAPRSLNSEKFWARVRLRNLRVDAEGARPPVFPAAAILRTMLRGRVDGAR